MNTYHSSIKRGFTLVEILVMVAAVGILAAITAPVISQARQNANRAACMSNLKQIGIAVHMYANVNPQGYIPWPNDETYGSMYQGMKNYTVSYELSLLLKPYVKSIDVFYDPGAQFYQNGAYTKENALKMNPPAIGYFYLNCRGWTGDRALLRYNKIPSGFAKKPCIMMCLGWPSRTDLDSGGPHKLAPTQNTTNYLYLDGHVVSKAKYDYPAGPGSGRPILSLPWDL